MRLWKNAPPPDGISDWSPEMIQNLTRGLGLLEETEFAARHDAEQMSKSIAEMRDALAKVRAINEGLVER